MIALDADVLTEILAGHPGFTQRAALIPAGEQSIPIIVVEEMIRGRLTPVHSPKSTVAAREPGADASPFATRRQFASGYEHFYSAIRYTADFVRRMRELPATAGLARQPSGSLLVATSSNSDCGLTTNVAPSSLAK